MIKLANQSILLSVASLIIQGSSARLCGGKLSKYARAMAKCIRFFALQFRERKNTRPTIRRGFLP